MNNYSDDFEETEDEEVTVGFLSLEMADKLIALKTAEGFQTFEDLFEQLLKDHAELKKRKLTTSLSV